MPTTFLLVIHVYM